MAANQERFKRTRKKLIEMNNVEEEQRKALKKK